MNTKLYPDAYPLSKQDTILGALGGSTMFSSVDLIKGIFPAGYPAFGLMENNLCQPSPRSGVVKGFHYGSGKYLCPNTLHLISKMMMRATLTDTSAPTCSVRALRRHMMGLTPCDTLTSRPVETRCDSGAASWEFRGASQSYQVRFLMALIQWCNGVSHFYGQVLKCATALPCML